MNQFDFFHKHQKCWYLNGASAEKKLAAQRGPPLHAGRRLYLLNWLIKKWPGEAASPPTQPHPHASTQLPILH